MDKDAIRIEYMPLDKLQRWPRNPKAHDLGALHVSINRFGFITPLIVDERTGKLAAGHGRLDALQQMKARGADPPARIVLSGLARLRSSAFRTARSTPSMAPLIATSADPCW